MAVARSPRTTARKAAKATGPVKSKRTKVLTTAMGEDRIAKTMAPKKPAKTIVEPAPTDWHAPHEPRPSRRSAVDRLTDPPEETGPALVSRIAAAIERELTQIEIIIGGNRIRPRERSEAERRARTLASLARTLAVITQLRAQQPQEPDDDDDAMPRDLDEFRETLARRLEGLLADRAHAADCEPEPE